MRVDQPISAGGRNKLEFHPAANVFPIANPDEFAALVESIRTDGFDPSHPIIIFEGKILDGRNRALAALEADVEPVCRQWDVMDGDPFAWNENAVRRHLDPGTLAACRVKMIRGQAERTHKREARANKARSEAAKIQPRGERGHFDLTGAVSRDTAPVVFLADRRERTEAALAVGVSEATMGRALTLER